MCPLAVLCLSRIVQYLRLIVPWVVFFRTMYSPFSFVFVTGVSAPGGLTYTFVIMMRGVAACAGAATIVSAAIVARIAGTTNRAARASSLTVTGSPSPRRSCDGRRPYKRRKGGRQRTFGPTWAAVTRGTTIAGTDATGVTPGTGVGRAAETDRPSWPLHRAGPRRRVRGVGFSLRLAPGLRIR